MTSHESYLDLLFGAMTEMPMSKSACRKTPPIASCDGESGGLRTDENKKGLRTKEISSNHGRAQPEKYLGDRTYVILMFCN